MNNLLFRFPVAYSFFYKVFNSIFQITKKILFFLLAIVILTGCESRRTIVNGLDEKEANEILVFLASKSIDAKKVQAVSEGGGGGQQAVLWNISVEETQANEAMALLNQVGLPRRRGQNLLGIFSNVGLVPSGLEQKIRYQAGLAEQIASTIRKIDGVLDAEVQLSIPEEDPLNPSANKQKRTASVYVKHSGVLDDPNAHLVTRIKRLVAGSVPGLDYDYVTVIPDRARFADIRQTSQSVGEPEKQYVNVWSVILAKESATRFRVIFGFLTISLALLLTGVIWLLWKFFPILQRAGGLKQLLNYHPIRYENLTASTEVEKAKQEKKKEGEEEKTEPNDSVDDSDTAGKDIDET